MGLYLRRRGTLVLPEEDTGEGGKPARELSAGTESVGFLISDLWPPELPENKVLLFKPPSLGCFIMAALRNEHSCFLQGCPEEPAPTKAIIGNALVR